MELLTPGNSKNLKYLDQKLICHTSITGGFLLDSQTLIKQAYAAFNSRNIDNALALMTESVSWPKASEGGRAVGKDEIRNYWTRQWQEFDPHVEPIEIVEQQDGTFNVSVHQLVKSLDGDVLFDGEVGHSYTIANSLIERMDIMDGETSSDSTPSAAFSKH
jgi:hypothetical protein